LFDDLLDLILYIYLFKIIDVLMCTMWCFLVTVYLRVNILSVFGLVTLSDSKKVKAYLRKINFVQ